MTSQEEQLVLVLQSKWGNRWSRIARKLPGRTDNDIKNFWRTHMRKKALERKRSAMSPSSPVSNYSSSTSHGSPEDSIPAGEIANKERSFYDTGGVDSSDSGLETGQTGLGSEKASAMDDNEIWGDIAFSGDDMMNFVFGQERCSFSNQAEEALSPLWEYASGTLWEESNMFFPSNDQFYSSLCGEHSELFAG